jgi:asparagine synthase (glutamine-hydrolysing)
MCGIAGFVQNGGLRPDESRGLVRQMCDAIRHRGPDDDGVWVSEEAALGMRRLSIIDLATGHQPIHNEDRTVWTVFNGEIYNFRELRQTLEALGHRFYTRTDTEVIVHAYEQWGAGAISRLRGMFGIAVWDATARRLLLARDRVGIKPLHYAEHAGRLYFGSEIKSILCAPDIARRVDVNALNHYLSFLYTPRDRSIFEGIHKLPPGHLLSWQDGHVRVEPYWQLPAEETFAGSEAEAEECLHARLDDAVKGHLVADVPVGAFLSGGIDSSLVVALASRHSSGLKTFSIGFEESAFNELPYARTMARHCGTDHHEFIVKPDGAAIVDDLIRHFDEPFADASAIPTWYVSQMARRHVTVVLSGDGGDELFGGYERYVPSARVAAVDRYLPPAIRRAAGLVGGGLPYGTRGKNFLQHIGRSDHGRYLDEISFFTAEEKAGLLSSSVREQLDAATPEAAIDRHFARYRGLPWPSQMMRFDAETYLPEDVLTKVDRMSMAHSIESRVPLLDNEVIDVAMSFPSDLKIANGRQKHVLKRVAERLLPAEVIARPKQGFAVPLGLWFRGALRELFGDTLLSTASLQRGYFERRFVERLVGEHLSGKRDHTYRLWQLLVFERWHRIYMDATAPARVSSHSEVAVS